MGATNPSVCLGQARKEKAADQFSWRRAWSKLPFLAFCWLSYVLIALVGISVFYIFLGALLHYLGDPPGTVGEMIKYGVWFLIAAVLFLLGAGLFLITATSLTGIDFLYPHKKRSITVRYLFPLAAALGNIFGVNRNTLRVSFVKVNNSLTIAQRRRICADRVLVLLPHCLQIDVCNRKITHDIDNCRRCGRCPVGSLLDMGKKHNLKIEVVNGGTLARRRVKSFRPDGIVAVACERDLTLGIQDVHPIPVFGVINDRPHGPCFNTEVDMGLVDEAIRFFHPQPERT